MSPRLVEVALPLPLFQTFTYGVPDALADPVVAGSRVVVPLRGGKEIGICVGESDPAVAPPAKVRGILAAPDREPAVDPPLLELCRWIAEYYVVPIGVALRSALPAALAGAAAPTPAVKTRRVAVVGRDLPS